MKKKYNSKSLAPIVLKKINQSKSKSAETLVTIVLDSIAEVLANGNGFTHKGLGSFEIVEYAEKEWVNPINKQVYRYPKQKNIKFKVHQNLKRDIRKNS